MEKYNCHMKTDTELSKKQMILFFLMGDLSNDPRTPQIQNSTGPLYLIHQCTGVIIFPCCIIPRYRGTQEHINKGVLYLPTVCTNNNSLSVSISWQLIFYIGRRGDNGL